MRTLITATVLTLTLAASPGRALDLQWSGEGALGGGFTTGNTETSDFGASLTLEGKGRVWTHTLDAAIDFAESAGTTTKDRQFLAYQADRDLSDRLFAYGRGSWERDEFSGYNSRLFAGVGLGYHVIKSAMTDWTLEGGPGYKRDEPTTGATEQNLSVRLGSGFSHSFNEHVTVGNDTDVLWTTDSTQVINSAALTSKLMGSLSARLSFDLRYDTDPRAGRESTDTTTRASLVYSFGA